MLQCNGVMGAVIDYYKIPTLDRCIVEESFCFLPKPSYSCTYKVITKYESNNSAPANSLNEQ